MLAVQEKQKKKDIYIPIRRTASVLSTAKSFTKPDGSYKVATCVIIVMMDMAPSAHAGGERRPIVERDEYEGLINTS